MRRGSDRTVSREERSHVGARAGERAGEPTGRPFSRCTEPVRLDLMGLLVLLPLIPACVAVGPSSRAASCDGTEAGLIAAFEEHVRSFNTPRDVETLLDFEEEMVEFGHGGADAKDFRKMTRDDHRRLLVAATARKDLYEWTPESVEARVTGNTGLVWGLYLRRDRPVGGETRVDRGRFTAAYLCSAGGWRAALWHRSPLRSLQGE